MQINSDKCRIATLASMKEGITGHRRLFPSLASKVVGALVAFLLFALGAIGLTLLQSWRLEGGAAAINDMGSERMRAYRMSYLLSEYVREGRGGSAGEKISSLANSFESTLASLRRGDPARPLSLPRDPEIARRVDALEQHWLTRIRPLIDRAVASPSEAAGALDALGPRIDPFVAEIDRIVGAIERNNAEATSLLRASQLTLVAFAIVGTIVIIYLMYLLVIRPVSALSKGILRLEAEDFSARVPVESRDEFGSVARAFNAMAAHLETLYETLEERVRDKTHRLEAKNRELSTLYSVTTALNDGHGVEALCRSFLHPIIMSFAADAGAVRLKHSADSALSIVVSEGLPPGFLDVETCAHAASCDCGLTAGVATPAEHDGAPQVGTRACRSFGYESTGVFPIRVGGRIAGVFNLYFTEPRALEQRERRLLEVLGRHLGTALESERLRSSEKELAVSEERNLIARELHDSIAQSLAFLNLQTQMLGESIERGDLGGAREEVAQIRAGVRESYDDVRELLVHFRSRIESEGLSSGLKRTLSRFEEQTGIVVSWNEEGQYVDPPAESQGQILHVVQEALSNIRKHARARHVDVLMRRGPMYQFTVRDDGVGFAVDSAGRDTQGHVGLQIMRERAVRIGGTLHVSSIPGAGTEVTLSLPVIVQQAA
ncbi:MAG: HAMP domain-containing protein [Betaproteobacteria bacterium]|nr:HAMP domain-containing protein [Betaproteobacteria bacterium]